MTDHMTASLGLSPFVERSPDLLDAVRVLVRCAHSHGINVDTPPIPEVPAQVALTCSRVVVFRNVMSGRARELLARLEKEPSLHVLSPRSDEVLILVGGRPQVAGDDRGLVRARATADLIRRHDHRFALGISSNIAHPGDVALGAQDARAAAAVADRRGGGVLMVEDCWAQITLDRMRASLTNCLTLANPMTDLAAYDQRRGTELVRSLSTWLGTSRRTIESAKRLNIHPNTMRYRLRRIGEVSGIDVTDPDQRLVAEVLATCRL